MKTILSLLLLMSSLTYAETGSDVFIRGKVADVFDEKEVKVIDSLNQTYFLPTSSFPKDFKFKQGAVFAIEVPEDILDNLKIKLPSKARE